MDTRWLRQRIRALGMTQRFLAQKMGMSAAGFNHKLHNRRPTTLREAAQLASWLQLNDAEVRAHFFQL